MPLARRGRVAEGSELFGKALEHFVIQEVRAYLSYRRLDLPLCYWRSTTQQEVDLVVGDALAVEIKGTSRVDPRHLTGLKALQEERKVRRFTVVSCDPLARQVGPIQLVSWRRFLDDLWTDRLF